MGIPICLAIYLSKALKLRSQSSFLKFTAGVKYRMNLNGLTVRRPVERAVTGPDKSIVEFGSGDSVLV